MGGESMSGLAVPSFILSRLGADGGLPHLVVTTLSAKTKPVHRHWAVCEQVGGERRTDAGELEIAPGTSAVAPATSTAEASAKGATAHTAAKAA